ncbi:phage portal protein [Jannaschia sp. Os4]|uniref:phage portal protein n=1 Tax=Jannaschia sp. Os4 TaxID=2807617 RepID=UPI00193AA3B7|nr:phage portal protein [Jannaschia sp. Os4]MBM2576820.1 phage portal protein [Jannaschia sp. Os4]
MFGWLKAPEAKASAARVQSYGGRSVWAARDSATLTRRGFEENPVGFRAVRMIAEAAAALPVRCDGMDAHPVLELLARPNAAQDGTAFVEALLGQMLLTGDGYVEGVEGQRELHVLRSDRMSVVPGEDGWPVGYDYRVGGTAHRFGVEAVCHLRLFHPTDDHYGLSPMAAAASAVEVHDAASRWTKGLLDNAARPSGAIVVGGEALTPEQFDRLSAEIEAHHQGARNAGRPMLLEGGLDWKAMGFSPSDMEFRTTKEAAAREIAMAFGVPPMLLGIPGDATYANYAEANRAFYRLTVLPLANKAWAGLSGFLGATLAVDMDRVPALSAERDAQWARIAGAAFLSDDEKRSLLGLS